jgi:hypothetical protein
MGEVDLWLVSSIAVFLNSTCDMVCDDMVAFYTRKGEVVLDITNREIRFIDWTGDDKTYFAIIGIGTMRDYTSNDYYTEK